MIVDSSALVAMLRDEDDATEFATAIEAAETVLVSAATVVETSLVIGPRAQSRLDKLLAEAELKIAPFDAEQAAAARTAHLRYGRGSGSKARLNFGDCFSYALAKATGLPLLFKGDDFTHTDIRPAA
ncbi:type II toxin-antitoxin system VapC family toxin [Nocardioides speluncae]|uniref:type II toxin-antitoxin system VapC family toxin n=1 Tax=Nocardioides speluncae TaxID=2670337 RepID=UPI000D6866FC|nr:type II toxin-antitoxin system VapC family toxin [Nocardioides speluncae]